MTNAEAVKFIEAAKRGIRLPAYKEAASFAITALEKQIAKKPRIEKNIVWEIDGDREVTEKFCPSCNTGFERECEYCQYCGQRIDWNDEHGAD